LRLKSIAVSAAFLAAIIGCEKRAAKAPRSDSTSTTAEPAHSEKADTVAAESTPASVITEYYEAINARRYDDAYRLWSRSGEARGKSETDFAAGFAQTQTVSVSFGDSVRTEGAAGSQYATIPVTIDATLRNGKHQHFAGTYTLRRSMVDGATPEQRAWRIYSADLK
jgi:hypothetical protein